MHHIGLGRRYAGIRVLVLVADLGVRVITEDGELLRELTLDPTRDYQRQDGLTLLGEGQIGVWVLAVEQVPDPVERPGRRRLWRLARTGDGI